MLPSTSICDPTVPSGPVSVIMVDSYAVPAWSTCSVLNRPAPSENILTVESG